MLTQITSLIQYYKEACFMCFLRMRVYTWQIVTLRRRYKELASNMFLFSVIHIGSQSPRSWLALSEMAREKLVPIAVDILPQFILKEHQSTQFSWWQERHSKQTDGTWNATEIRN